MIWILLVIYQLKHYLADFPLQNAYMLGKFQAFPKFILPLLSHGLVHGVFTFLIALCLKDWHIALYLALFDTAVHCVVDWVKANPSIGGRFNALSKAEMKTILSYIPTLGEAEVKTKFGDQLKSNTYFWWALGIDQGLHHLTHYFIIAMLVLK